VINDELLRNNVLQIHHLSLIISQDQILVETFENQEGKWVYNDFKGAEAIVTIGGLEIPLSILYQNVDFTAVEV
jgi:hypothetical protein